MTVVSIANHDPDFDLAKGSHQVAMILRIDSNDFRKGGITNTILSLHRLSKRIEKEFETNNR